MVQTRTTDCRNSLRRHWLHGEQTNSKTGTAQRYPNGILNHSQRYTDGKPGWCINTSRVSPPPLLPLSGGSKYRRGFLCLPRRVSRPQSRRSQFRLKALAFRRKREGHSTSARASKSWRRAFPCGRWSRGPCPWQAQADRGSSAFRPRRRAFWAWCRARF